MFTSGALAVPVGVGVTIGYWVADAGVRWVPSTLGFLAVFVAVGLVLMAVGSHLGATESKPRQKRIVSLAVLAALAIAVRIGVWYASTPSVLSARPEPEFLTIYRADAQQMTDLDRGLYSARATLTATVPANGVLDADAERVVADAWAAYVNQAFALDQLRRFYEDYYHLDLSRLERRRHTLAFLLTFAAELALFEHTLVLQDAVAKNSNVVKFLDLPRPSHHLAAESWTAAKDDLLGVSDYSRVVAGQQYMAYLATLHAVDDDVRAAGYGWLWEDVAARIDRIAAHPSAKVAFESVTGDLGPLQRSAKNFSFPVQKGVAEWMGDTRVKRAGRYLIDEAMLDDFETYLAPGDVMLARKNWYLSNVGLPGFWPHALLYAGSREAIATAFDDDPAVKAWVKTMGHERFSTYLATTYPQAWANADRRPIVEAVSEGVVQSDLHHAGGDYVAALRPDLPALAKAKAIDRAYRFLGRPYDFDFDFATDHALVCTELVWRSYRPEGGTPGLRLPLSKIAGRLTLPANDIARVYREEQNAGVPQFSLVRFIEGREHHQDAVERGADEFAATVDRSKWDFGQP